jgi:hypothetical protein
MIKKTLQPTNDLFIQFTEEELSSIGAGPGTKFEAKLHDDGSIELRPYVKIELDTEDWPREVLEFIVKESCEKDISANDVINNLLKESLNSFEENSTECSYENGGLKSICGYSSNEAVLPTASNSSYSTSSGDSLITSSATDSINFKFASTDPNFTNNDTSVAYGDYSGNYRIENDMLYSG